MTRLNGFTLIEVLAALAILGVAMFVLLDAHFSALKLHETMDEEVIFRQLSERTASLAELEVRAGNLSGAGDFGTRHPGLAWSYEALPSGSDDTILLYEVNVTITAPEEDRQLKFFVYDTGLGSLLNSGTSTSTTGAGLTSTAPTARPASGSTR